MARASIESVLVLSSGSRAASQRLEAMMNSGQSGTRDKTYDIVAVLYHALQGAENCETYCEDASDDQELRSFFEQALNQQRQLADRAKHLLQSRLGGSGQGQSGEQGSSAFAFGQGQSGSGSDVAGEQQMGSTEAQADRRQAETAEQGSSGASYS